MASLSSDGLQLADERRNEERFPASVDVNRTLDRVSVQIAADTAVLTAVMTERSSDNGAPPRSLRFRRSGSSAAISGACVRFAS